MANFSSDCGTAPKKSIEEAPVQLANPREWLKERYIVAGFPLPSFSSR